MSSREDAFTDIDPITVEVIRGYLQSTLQNMITRLIRSALSPNITERMDVSSAIIDPNGRTVVQLEVAPIHLAELAGAGNSLLENYPLSDISPGDVFIVNDCYSGGGTHLPDVTIMMPVFAGERLVGIVANLAHHVDIGGTGGAGAATIYDEGLRIPVTRLVEAGELREDVLRFILLNCRLPEQRRGDLVAQIAANELAAKDLVQLCERHGADTVLATYNALQEYAKRKLRGRIGEMPDGVYEFVDYLDDDGSGETMIPVRVVLTVANSELHVDFAGTGPQTDGNINLVAHGTEGCVLYALRAALDPTIPPTSAFMDCVQLSLPERSLVNPSPPAGCRARVDTAQRVVGVLLGALAQALPDRLPAGGCDALQACNLSGDDAEGVFYSMVETFGGGSGALPAQGRPGRDPGSHGERVQLPARGRRDGVPDALPPSRAAHRFGRRRDVPRRPRRDPRVRAARAAVEAGNARRPAHDPALGSRRRPRGRHGRVLGQPRPSGRRADPVEDHQPADQAGRRLLGPDPGRGRLRRPEGA